MDFEEESGTRAFLLRARREGLRDFGACMAPMTAFHILQGIETLHLRMPRHVENTRKVVAYLAGHEMVEKLAATGIAQPVIAGVLDMADRTFRNRMAEDEKLRLAWERGHAQWHALINRGIHDKVKEGNTRMLIFLAKAQLGMRETSRVEIVDGVEEELKRLAAEDAEDDGE